MWKWPPSFFTFFSSHFENFSLLSYYWLSSSTNLNLKENWSFSLFHCTDFYYTPGPVWVSLGMLASSKRIVFMSKGNAPHYGHNVYCKILILRGALRPDEVVHTYNAYVLINFTICKKRYMFIKLSLIYQKLECQVKTLFFQILYPHKYNSCMDFRLEKLIPLSILVRMTGLSALYPDGTVFVLWLLYQKTMPDLNKLCCVW